MLSRDEAGQLVKRVDTRGGAAWLTDEVAKSVFGQNLSHTGLAAGQGYAYDAAGRLTQVTDTPTTGNCTTRRYRFDANSNRVGLTSTASADRTCAVGATPEVTIGYDSSDRLLTAGTVYDSFGRTTTAAAATVTGGADLAVGYFANDLVASQTQGGTSQSWTLDQGQQRLRTATTVVSGSTTKAITNHYDDASSDSPAWIAETADGTSWTANVTDLLGSLAATVNETGTVIYQYANLHGDIQGTCPAAAPAATLSPNTDEYGNTATGSAVPRYGWLGGKQRSGDDLAGLTLMGVRLYNPLSGRFLSTDPVPGGSANAYDYVGQDPINHEDLAGTYTDSDGHITATERKWLAFWTDPCSCVIEGNINPHVYSVISFFSDRAYVTGFNQLVHGHPVKAGKTVLVGEGGSFVLRGTGKSVMPRGRHAKPPKGLLKGFGKFALRVTSTPAALTATFADYVFQPSSAAPNC